MEGETSIIQYADEGSTSLAPRWFLNFLNSGDAQGASIETHYVNAITLIGIPNIFASVLIEHSVDNDRMALFMGFIILCVLANAWLLRKTMNASRASSGVLLIMLLMLSVMVFDGMYQDTAPIWCATFPAVAFFFKGKRRGMEWLTLQITILLLLIMLQGFDLFHSPFSNAALLLVIASILTVGMMVYVYESMRSRAEASLREAKEKLYHLAHTDILTSLPNRIAFYDHLPQALAQSEQNREKLAVLFIDLDNFKPINDTFGHEVGDQLLCQAANRLRNQLRADDYIARIGGDEFVATLQGIAHPHEAGIIADKLIKALTAPFTIEHHRCTIGVSIGIALYPHCASDIDGLIQLADHAMYRVKESGKNGYAICPFDEHDPTAKKPDHCRCNQHCHNSNEFDFPLPS